MKRILKIVLLLTIFILAASFIIYESSFKIKEIDSLANSFLGEDEIKLTQLTLKKKASEGKRIEDSSEANWQWVYNQKKLYQSTTTEINLTLKELQQRFPNKDERLKALSILRLDTPYQLGCLGEEAGRDKDPIFRLDVTDCTVFVLTNAALLHSQTFKEAKEMMKFLNYRPEKNLETEKIEYKITFENRLHFTADRNIASLYFQDITKKIAGSDRIKEKTVILNKIKADGNRLIDIDWEKEIVIEYIPNEYITKELFAESLKAIGIAFIKEGDEEIGLDVRHEGLLFNGNLLFHASSTQGKIVAVDFFDYYFRKDSNSRFDGVILFSVR